MNYDEIVKNSQGRAAEGLLATKIIDLMDKLRLEATDLSARRWIWELLQNAKDCAADDSTVRVSISMSKTDESAQLRFAHNGQPFSTDNIISLIHQVSSKKRKNNSETKKKPTGKFGTGFLSTHLLSEIVEVQGIVKEDGLPYKEFVIELDRRPNDPDEILESVNNSLVKIVNVLNSEDALLDYDAEQLNTAFIYKLQTKKISIAEKGIADLHISLPYTLAFTSEISEVNIEHEQFCYKVSSRRPLQLKGLEIVTIQEEDLLIEAIGERKLVVYSGQHTSIALEILENNGFIEIKPFTKEMPRLFCDFPLVGSENFQFPVIINSSSFNINEPRNGVWLTNIEDDRILQNETLIQEALDLLKNLIKFAASNNWQGLFEFAKISPAEKSEWLSKEWYDRNVLDEIRNLILYEDIVDTSTGRVAILKPDNQIQVMFPYGISDEVMKEIWLLGEPFYKFPIINQIEDWAQVIWKSNLRVTLPVLANRIVSYKNLQTLQEDLGSNCDSIDWLNHFYKVMNLDKEFLENVIADKYAILPNQKRQFKFRSELNIAKDIQEYVKDAVEILKVDIRDKLLFDGVYTGNTMTFTVLKEQKLIEEINTQLSSTSTEAKFKYEVCDFLVSLFPENDKDNFYRTKMYQLSKTIYSNIEDKKFVKENPDLWKEADKLQLKTIVSTVAKEKNISQFAETNNLSEEESLAFISELAEFIIKNEMDNQLNLSSKPILPNQYGDFKIKDEINLDDGEIADALKTIATKLDYNVKTILLDKRVFLELPPNRTITVFDVAGEISSKVMSATTLSPRPEEIKEAFRLLLLYFIDFPEYSQQLFSDLYFLKHKLYDDQEIATNLKQAEDVKQLMEDMNIGSLAEMRDLLSKGISSDNKIQEVQESITTEMLASWGITTMEEYITLAGADVSSSIFKHYSVPTLHMLEIAHSLIERAKKNIVKYLQDHPEYNLDEMELIAPTVIAGITKLGVRVHIVFRPSDNGEVLFYYPSEKATLDLDNAELWVENGFTEPQHLTLGKILTSTGINRIPINENN